MTHYLGVDPGIGGAWAVLRDSGEAVACGFGHASPRGGLAGGLVEPIRLARFGTDLVAAIEVFPARPGFGVKSLAGLWRGVGAWEVVIEEAGWPAPIDVPPKRWQALLFVASAIAEHEADARAAPDFADLSAKAQQTRLRDARRRGYHAAACERWPDLGRPRGILWGPRGAVIHDLAAALWIAEYARTR